MRNFSLHKIIIFKEHVFSYRKQLTANLIFKGIETCAEMLGFFVCFFLVFVFLCVKVITCKRKKDTLALLCFLTCWEVVRFTLNILVLLLETNRTIVDIREEKAALTENLTIQPYLLEACVTLLYKFCFRV